MKNATISADVVSYTSLTTKDKRALELGIGNLLGELSKKYKNHSFYGRMVQGDTIECALNSPIHVLRIALMLKTFVKSFQLSSAYQNNRIKHFKEHGIRLAIAVDELQTLDRKKGIIDGEAIYKSGRKIKSMGTSNKQRVVIKNTMYFLSSDELLQDNFDTIVKLLDTIISKCSAKQSEVIYHKLMGFNEIEIAGILNKNQSTISQHSTAAGWHAIEISVDYFERRLGYDL
jgi:hypothetical protein